MNKKKFRKAMVAGLSPVSAKRAAREAFKPKPDSAWQVVALRRERLPLLSCHPVEESYASMRAALENAIFTELGLPPSLCR